MLVSLGIRNLAVLEEIDLAFGEGLTVLTGETGAGKSVLLDALGLATGRRADIAMVRPGAERASVTARFEVAGDHAAAAFLEARGIDCDGEIIVRRQVRADGRSHAFVNDEPVSVAALADLGERLAEVCGQQDQRGLLRVGTHRALLDAFGGHGDLCERVRGSHRAWRAARRTLENLADEETALAERRRALERDVAELAALDPRDGEEESLAGLRATLANSHRIAEALALADDAIDGEDGAEVRLGRAATALRRVADSAGESLGEALDALDRALAEIAEASGGLAAAARDLETDGGRLEETEERLFALRAAARRYGTSVDELGGVRERLEGELAAIDDRERGLKQAAAAERDAREAFDAACEALTGRRARAGRRLDEAVSAELAPLRMSGARFETALEALAPDSRTADGAETVLFRVSTVADSPPGPLNRIASGGELSRLMLALRVAGRAGGTVPTLVFDEIDAGIGGAVASAVGARLRRLGEGAQVLAVTHAPQIAAQADHHVRLAGSGGKRRATSAVALDGTERREELARMLSGAEITEEARAAASSLLDAGAP